MPLAYKVTRVSILGSAFGGAEHWSTGFYMGYADGAALAPTEAGAAQIAGYWQTFFTNIAHSVANTYKTDAIKLQNLGTDGKGIPTETAYFYPGTPYAGGVGTSPHPPQVSLVASLLAAPGQGVGRKGRMYLPGINESISSTTGKISTTFRGTIATGLKTFFDACNSSIDAVGDVILASPGSKPPLLWPSTNRKVLTVKVGDVYDTQRRRRNELAEQYSSVTLAA